MGSAQMSESEISVETLISYLDAEISKDNMWWRMGLLYSRPPWEKTFTQACKEAMRRRQQRRKGQRVSLQAARQGLQGVALGTRLSAESWCAMVPGMQSTQAQRLISSA